MFNKVVKVSECPHDIQVACDAVGINKHQQLSIQRAMEAWAAYHLGDECWGTDACEHMEWLLSKSAPAPNVPMFRRVPSPTT